MIKKFMSLVILVGFLNANMVNGIALIVNDSPISLYDIDLVMQKYKISKDEAIGFLIDEQLYDNEMKNNNIHINRDDVNAFIDQLAQTNNMNTYEFKKMIEQRQPFEIFLQDAKRRLQNRQLIQKIAMGKLQIATKEDVKLYYENNIQEFKVGKDSIAVIPLEQVQESIFNKIMLQREKQYLKEYFEALKITANIKIIR
jgi:hypothetical protein